MLKAAESVCPSHAPSHWSPHSGYTSGRRYYRECQGLTSIPANIPGEAGGVYIAGNTIHTLRANDFIHLTHCTELWLSYNEINEIQVGAFTGLTALEVLDLEKNKITIIEPGTFSGLTALRRLYMNHNVISEIQSGLFTGLTALEDLSLSGNNISHIEPGTFSGLPALTWLSLHSNALTTLPWTVFGSVGNPGNINHPARLVFSLSGNPLRCDTSLCWIKQAEQEGWLEWSFSNYDPDYDPECSNYAGTDWPDVNLDCNIHSKSTYHIHYYLLHIN